MQSQGVIPIQRFGCGGCGQNELERAGADRVYQDPADLLKHIDEVGVRATV